MKPLHFLIVFYLFGSCGINTPQAPARILELRFLDSYVIPAKTTFENTEIGGLSGIDFDGDEYFLICDQPSNPRFYTAIIKIENNRIDTVIFNSVVELDTENIPFFKENRLDMEAIRRIGENLVISSEGSIDKHKNPSVFEISPQGEFIANYILPEYFTAEYPNHPRNNGVFEGLSESWDGKGIWVSTELPLKKDGPAPQLGPSISPVRITYFDKDAKTGRQAAKKQFAYLLERIPKPPLLPFSINGLSEILEIEKNRFLTLERGFSAGYGMKGNTIRLFEIDASKATNTLEMDSLKHKMNEIKVAEKSLLFDFETIREKLPDEIIDNIEGFTFGPILPNGNKSLILVADNNFNRMGMQLNQVILMELTQN